MYRNTKQYLYKSVNSYLPTPGNVIFTILMIAITLWAQSAGAISLGVMTAQTSTDTIPYQGYLTDANGTPLTGHNAMKFCLYNSAIGGSALWCEQWNGSYEVEITDGLFHVLLGSLNAIPQNIVSNNNNLFLGVAVADNGEMSPRVQLGSVPTAIQALTVPDGSITSNKVKLSHGEARAKFDPWHSPLTVDFIEIPGTRVELTLDTPQTLIVNGHFDFLLENNSWGEGGLIVNRNRVPKLAILQTSSRGNVGQTWIVNLNAGTHTFHLSARKRYDSGVVSIVQSHTNLTWFSFAR